MDRSTRDGLRAQITALTTTAIALRNAFSDTNAKRSLDNMATDLGTFDRMLPDRDDLLQLLLIVKGPGARDLARAAEGLSTERPGQ